MRTLLSAAIVALLTPLAACGAAPLPPATPAGGSGATAAAAPLTGTPEAPVGGDIKPLGEAKVGDKTKCAVMKHEFVVTESSPKVVYEGKTYYFCCPGCVERFNADPKKYLSTPQS